VNLVRRAARASRIVAVEHRAPPEGAHSRAAPV
jgi:hypothetical protein